MVSRLGQLHRSPRLRAALSLSAFAMLAALGAREASATRVLDVSPTSFTFPDTIVGGTPTARVFSLSSNGDTTGNDGSVDVMAFTKAGTASCAAYTVASTPAVPPTNTLALGDSMTVTITFTPGSATAFNGCVISVTDTDGLSDTITVSGVGVLPQMLTTPAGPLSFGSQRVNGGATAAQQVRVDNDGSGTLTTTLTLGGANPGDFSINPTSLGALAGPNGFASVDVTFNPTAAGARSATLTVAGNDPNNASDVITLTGTGTTAVIALSPSPLAIGTVAVGSNTSANLSVANSGTGGLAVDGMAITGAGASSFTIESQSCTGVQTCGTNYTTAGAATTLVTIRCTPVSAGLKNAILTIDSDAESGTETVTLTCTGAAPVMLTSPGSLSFGSQRVSGGATAAQPVRIDNDGGADLAVTLTLGGANPGDFAINPTNLPAIVGPTGFSTVDVTFNPTALGARTATLTVSGNDPANPSDVITLTGTGTSATVSLSPSPVAIGNVAVGGSRTANLSVQNTGTASFAVDDVTITGADASSFTIESQGCSGAQTCSTNFTVAAATTTTVVVRCAPATIGAKTATLTVDSDADSGTETVSLTCTGSNAVISLSPSPLAFGNVTVATGSNQTLSVQNTGTTGFQVINMAISGADAASFTIESQGCSGGQSCGTDYSVAGGATASVVVSCTPASIGAKNATLTIDSDADSGTETVALTCTGTLARISALPTPLGFGSVRLGESSAAQTVTVANTGNLPVSVSDIDVGDGQFALSGLPTFPRVLTNNGDSFSFQVTFVPASTGLKSSTVVIQSDANDPVIAVSGTGTLADLEITPTTDYDFGDVRYDQAAVSQLFTVTNTGDATWQFAGVQIDNTADFSLLAGGNQAVGPGGSVSFSVLALPASMGEKTGTVTINTDIPGATQVQLTVTANGIAPDMEVLPAAVDFGGHDVQLAAPTVRTVTIENTGSATLAISGAVITGPDAALFALAADFSGTGSVSVAGSFDLDVEFQPDLETPEATPLEASLEITTDAVSGGAISIPLSGFGADRHIDLDPDVIDFGEVYRNPATPSTMTFAIENNGAAALGVTMVMEGGAAPEAFAVVGDPPSTVAGNGSSAVTVSFAPPSASSVPFEATLLVYNDDDGAPMAAVSLRGVGVLPAVMVSPGAIEFGRTGVGIPVEVAAIVDTGIRIVNMDPQQAFTVREIRVFDADGAELAADGAFQLQGFTPGMELTAGGTAPVNLVFAAPDAGEFTGTLRVYLDADSDEIGFVTLHGEAVEVDLRGGGCAAGGSGGAGRGLGLALVAAAGALALRRRGRRAAVIAAAVVGLALGLVAPRPAAGQPTRDIDLSTFSAAPGVENDLFSVESPEVGASGAWAIGVVLNHATNPLHVASPQVEGMVDAPITGRTGLDLSFAYAFAGRFEAGLRLPMLAQSGDDPMFSGLAPADGMALGDLELHAKAALLRSAALSFAGSLGVSLPTASAGQFAGVDDPTAHLRLIAGIRAGRIRVAFNGGVHLRGQSQLGDLDQGNELSYGAATSYRLVSKLWLIGELFGGLGLGGGETAAVTPAEAVLGVRYRASDRLSVALGGGRGLLPGVGAPDVRGFLMLSFAQGSRAPAPLLRDRDSDDDDDDDDEVPIDRGDDDGDGVINSSDECADAEEDADGFRDDDGCPDPDNDGDGFADGIDPCPNEAEDKDGFKDDDGCIDADNDGDGIDDVDDRCPTEQEDKDGYQDLDGCDDPDNDHDGIPDVIDQCALESETINGNGDDDGCPDLGDSLVLVMADRIEVFEAVRFGANNAKIQKRSFNVLGQVAATLRANRDFLLVRVAAHVHPRNSRDAELSEKRAQAVLEWLTQWGIEPERLEIKGFGSTRPLVQKGQKGAEDVNDRVEFVLIEKKVKAEQ